MELPLKDMRTGWEKARDEGRKLTCQQLLAEKTGGIVRLPNIMTATGIGLTMLGAHYAREHKPLAATASIAGGMAFDVEGAVARHFGVEDPVHGGRFDQLADFIKASIVAETLVGQRIMPVNAAVLTYGPKVAGAAAGITAKLTHNIEIPSSRIGKFAEVCRDIVPPAFLLAAAGRKFDRPQVEKAGSVVAWAAVGAAAVFGTIAAINYARDARSEERAG